MGPGYRSQSIEERTMTTSQFLDAFIHNQIPEAVLDNLCGAQDAQHGHLTTKERIEVLERLEAILDLIPDDSN